MSGQPNGTGACKPILAWVIAHCPAWTSTRTGRTLTGAMLTGGASTPGAPTRAYRSRLVPAHRRSPSCRARTVRADEGARDDVQDGQAVVARGCAGRLAGSVDSRRDGRRLLYRVTDPHVVTLVHQVVEHVLDLRTT
jgi:hypothetical protein